MFPGFEFMNRFNYKAVEKMVIYCVNDKWRKICLTLPNGRTKSYFVTFGEIIFVYFGGNQVISIKIGSMKFFHRCYGLHGTKHSSKVSLFGLKSVRTNSTYSTSKIERMDKFGRKMFLYYFAVELEEWLGRIFFFFPHSIIFHSYLFHQFH